MVGPGVAEAAVVVEGPVALECSVVVAGLVEVLSGLQYQKTDDNSSQVWWEMLEPELYGIQDFLKHVKQKMYYEFEQLHPSLYKIQMMVQNRYPFSYQISPFQYF